MRSPSGLRSKGKAPPRFRYRPRGEALEKRLPTGGFLAGTAWSFAWLLPAPSVLDSDPLPSPVALTAEPSASSGAAFLGGWSSQEPDLPTVAPSRARIDDRNADTPPTGTDQASVSAGVVDPLPDVPPAGTSAQLPLAISAASLTGTSSSPAAAGTSGLHALGEGSGLPSSSAGTAPVAAGPMGQALAILSRSSFSATGSTSAAGPARGSTVARQLNQLPLSFEANQGQAAPSVQFLARTNGSVLLLTATEAVLSLQAPAASTGQLRTAAVTPPPALLHLQVVGGSSAAQPVGQDTLPGKVNYFLGNDPAHWHTNVPTYARVEYPNVYPGISLDYYGSRQQLEYDFTVAPGADPGRIALAFAGADRVTVDGQGDLVVEVAGQEVREHRPVLYQEVDGQRQQVNGAFVLTGANQVDFQVAVYDRSQPLVIDPVLSYSTYLGGSGDSLHFGDAGQGIAVDAAGSAYVVGGTHSADFPTLNPLLPFNGNEDAFVSKLSADGSTLLYSTYLGGSVSDEGNAIAVDTAGNAYVTGLTSSTDYPTVNAFQPTFGGGLDAYVTKLSADGSQLVYSTYLGGSGMDYGSGIAVDAAGSAYVTGTTRSTDFPTVNALQSVNKSESAFITKLTADGSALVYSTYLGGSYGTQGQAIAVDGDGNAYVTGDTISADFPAMNALQPRFGGDKDAFVTKLNATGSALVYSTYLGGSSQDEGTGIAADAAGNAYVTGWTQSDDFPTANALQPVKNGVEDAFVSKITADGSAFVYSTFLGGSMTALANGIAVDPAGNAYVTGWTIADDFPSVDPLQPPYGTGTFFKSTDGGGDWGSIDQPLLETEIYALAVDPVTPSTLYAGAGSNVIKSTDGGATWQQSLDLFGGIYNVVVAPSNPAVLYAGVAKGGLPHTAAYVYHSTDGGATWSGVALPGNYIKALAVDPTMPSTVYASDDTGLIFRSTDGGATWQTVQEFSTAVLAVDPTTPGTVYAAGYNGVLKSTDGGTTWSPVSNGLMGQHVFALAIDPTTPSTLYAGTPNGVFRTSDGGANWSPTSLAGVDVSSLAVDPLTPATVYASTYAGGVFKSTDGGGAWGDSNGNLANGYIGPLALDPLTPSTVYAAASADFMNAFVTEVTADGSGLVYSTPLGGSRNDEGLGIAVDGAGNAYVTGDTLSTDFPTVKPFQPSLGGINSNAFVAKISPDAGGLTPPQGIAAPPAQSFQVSTH